MMTDREKMVVGVIGAIVLIYLVASATNVVPEGYNIFKLWEDEEVVLHGGEGYIEGFPTTVNVTAQENNSYSITIGCNESYVAGMTFVIDKGTTLDNTTVYWTATSTDWHISSDGYEAYYDGDALSNDVEINSLIFHVDGGDVEGTIDITVTADTGTLTPDEFEVDVLI